MAGWHNRAHDADAVMMISAGWVCNINLRFSNSVTGGTPREFLNARCLGCHGLSGWRYSLSQVSGLLVLGALPGEHEAGAWGGDVTAVMLRHNNAPNI